MFGQRVAGSEGSSQVDGILIAHVADAITAVTGDGDYDAVADRAAELLKRRSEVEDAAARYARGDLDFASLQRMVADHLR